MECERRQCKEAACVIIASYAIRIVIKNSDHSIVRSFMYLTKLPSAAQQIIFGCVHQFRILLVSSR